MKLNRVLPHLIVWFILVGVATSSRAEPREYQVDPEHFTIAFAVDHLGFGDVLGLFLSGQASFIYDEEARQLISAQASIDADSVFTDVEARDRHLRSGDFLNASTSPTINFVAQSATPISQNTGRVTGDLTIRGVTRPVTLNVELVGAGGYPFPTTGPEPNYVLGVTMTTSFLRSDFGMTYAVDNGWVGDQVDLTISFEAIRQ